MINFKKIFVCLFLITLMGCSNNNSAYILKGDSEHWKGDLRATSTGNNKSGKYTFYYKKDDWKDVGRYTITIGNKEVILNEEGLDNRSISITVAHFDGFNNEEKKTKHILIEWNGKKEEINLSN